MESMTESPVEPRKRGLFARLFAALVIAAGMVKAIAFIVSSKKLVRLQPSIILIFSRSSIPASRMVRRI